MKALILGLTWLYICVGFFNFPLSGQNIQPVDSMAVRQKAPYDGKYALIIGNSDYTKGWKTLPDVKNEVKEVGIQLSRIGFDTLIRENVNQLQFTGVIRDFLTTYGSLSGNGLVIYYAGHAHTLRNDNNTYSGFLVPVDAPLPDSAGRVNNAFFPVHDLFLTIKTINSYHTLWIFNALFSDSIFNQTDLLTYMNNSDLKSPVRQYIVAGEASDTVHHSSAFYKRMIAGLEGEADILSDSLNYLTGAELAQFITDTVFTQQAKLHPRFGIIKVNDHVNGDFHLSYMSSVDGNSLEERVRAGDLEITSTLNGALIVDRKKAGEIERNKPVRLTLPEGRHYVLIDGRRQWSRWIDIKAGAITKVNANIVISDFCEMVLVEGGKFVMGEAEVFGTNNTAKEEIVQDFYIGKYEITQKQWRSIMQFDPAGLYHRSCDECPVENVSYDSILKFIERLNKISDIVYRLPTEPEWEYSAIGGANRKQKFRYSGGNNPDSVAWYMQNSMGKSQPVGKKAPNELGLHDMSGNVWEWCGDEATRQATHVLKGGSWYTSDVKKLRSSGKKREPNHVKGKDIGFRLARSVY